MNSLTFSQADFPDLNCKVGQEETVTVTFTPTSVTGGEVTGDVTNVAYAEPDEGSADEEGAADEETEPTPSKPSRAIVAIGIPGGKKGY